MNRIRVRALARLALLGSVSLWLAGCSDIMYAVTGAYRGPQPVAEGLSREEVVIRRVTSVASNPAFVIDRVRYVQAGDPHDINRAAIVVATDATRAQVSALDLQPGDRVILSTTFNRVTTESGSLSIPNWPGPGRPEYPLGIHSIVAIVRAGN